MIPNSSREQHIGSVAVRRGAVYGAAATLVALLVVAVAFEAANQRPATVQPSPAACEQRMRADLAQTGRVNEAVPECAGLGDLADIEQRVLFG